MSTITKQCDPQVKIETTSLQSLDFCSAVSACPAVQNNKSDIAKANARIGATNKRTDEVVESNKTLAENVANESATNRRQDQQLSEINANISMIKGWNSRQDSEIQSLETKVIVDTTHNSFHEWVQNVYLPNCGNAANKYTRGSFYMNASTSPLAEHSTYVNIRDSKSTAPCSINDWQVLEAQSASSMLAILGIDPIEVAHISASEWVIRIDPRKLEIFLSKLKSIDFTEVDITLKDVYGTPTFYDDATFKKNVVVEQKMTATDARVKESLDVEGTATVKHLTIAETVEGEATFSENVHMKESLDVANHTSSKTLDVTESATINRATIQDLHIPGYNNNLQWIIADIYSKIR